MALSFRTRGQEKTKGLGPNKLYSPGDYRGESTFPCPDGKAYQFRVKSSMYDSHSYKFIFETNSNWQIIQIPFNLLSPSFRGRDLKIPNFSGNNVEEIGFLIANKKEEDFQLKIDYIKSI